MALKKCKECGHKISVKADKCPSCGAPQADWQKTHIPLMKLIVVGLGAWFVYVMVKPSDETYSEAANDPSRVTAAAALTESGAPADPPTASAASTASTNGIKYEIISEEPNAALSKNVLRIRLRDRVDKQTLLSVATTLRQNRKQYERLWIFYYLPDMPPDDVAWATSSFTPNLELKIFGATEEQDTALKSVSAKSGTTIGRWRYNRPYADGTMIIYRQDGKLFLDTTYYDGSSGTDEITESRSAEGSIRYDYMEPRHGEYFVLEANGNLGLYDADGKIGEGQKLQ